MRENVKIKIGKLQRAVIEFLDEGALLTMAMIGSGGSSKGLFRALRELNAERLNNRVLRAAHALKRRRLIRMKQEGEEVVMRLTREGKERALRYLFGAM